MFVSHSSASAAHATAPAAACQLDDCQASYRAVWSAEILFRGHYCRLSLDAANNQLTITRVSQSGKQATLLTVPTSLVLNLETVEESARRQRMRDIPDSVVRKGFSSTALTAVCRSTSVGLAEHDVVWTSGGTLKSEGGATGMDTRAAGHTPRDGDSAKELDRVRCNGAGAPAHAAAGRHGVSDNTPSGVCPGESSSAFASQRPAYRLHYIQALESERIRIRTVLFSLNAVNEVEAVGAEFVSLQTELLHRVYTKGVKSVLVFVSPKSGNRKGVSTYATQVYPLLHFSRHRVNTFVTTRAHDCEDYIADLQNRLDGRDVVVGAGGDGMVHELVNGLHRRRVALVQQCRRESTQRRGCCCHGRGGGVACAVEKTSGLGQTGDVVPLPHVQQQPQSPTCGAKETEAVERTVDRVPHHGTIVQDSNTYHTVHDAEANVGGCDGGPQQTGHECSSAMSNAARDFSRSLIETAIAPVHSADETGVVEQAGSPWCTLPTPTSTAPASASASAAAAAAAANDTVASDGFVPATESKNNIPLLPRFDPVELVSTRHDTFRTRRDMTGLDLSVASLRTPVEMSSCCSCCSHGDATRRREAMETPPVRTARNTRRTCGVGGELLNDSVLCDGEQERDARGGAPTSAHHADAIRALPSQRSRSKQLSQKDDWCRHGDQTAVCFSVDELFAADEPPPTLYDGWDAVLPLIATIATGSACGMAKAMGVLSSVQAALSLIHLHSCRIDLLNMYFRPNPDMLAYHTQKLSRVQYYSCHRKYALYRSLYSSELQACCRPPTTSPAPARIRDGRSAAVVLSPTPSRLTDTHSPCATPTAAADAQVRRPQSAPTGNAATARAGADRLSPAALPPTQPFLLDGSPVVHDAVSFHVGAPSLAERVAFMSLSYGVANDIDRGSEALRWMGNTRFTVYGGYMLLKGLQSYCGRLRYLPWVDSVTGKRIEKLHTQDKMPHSAHIPRCTLRSKCRYCDRFTPVSLPFSSSLSLRRTRAAVSRAASTPSAASCPVHRRETVYGGGGDGDNSDDALGATLVEPLSMHDNVSIPTSNASIQSRGMGRDGVGQASRCSESAAGSGERHARDDFADSAASMWASHSDEELLGVDVIDFDDESLPWVTIRGEFYNLMCCNLPDVAQDMVMAPVSHLSDGAIDLVFARKTNPHHKGARRNFLRFFSSLESGTHVDYHFVSYVKARAVEIKMDGGISMADGEMMPLGTVRVTKIRHALSFVRSE